MLRAISLWTEAKDRGRTLHGKWKAGDLGARSTKGHKRSKGHQLRA